MSDKSRLEGLKARRAELARRLAALEGSNVTLGSLEGEHEVRIDGLKFQIVIQDVAIEEEEARLSEFGGRLKSRARVIVASSPSRRRQCPLSTQG